MYLTFENYRKREIEIYCKVDFGVNHSQTVFIRIKAATTRRRNSKDDRRDEEPRERNTENRVIKDFPRRRGNRQYLICKHTPLFLPPSALENRRFSHGSDI